MSEKPRFYGCSCYFLRRRGSRGVTVILKRLFNKMFF